MSKYEDQNLREYLDGDPRHMLISDPGKAQMRHGLDEIVRQVIQCEQLKNPYKEAMNWIKGEILDLGSILEALLQREQVVSRRK